MIKQAQKLGIKREILMKFQIKWYWLKLVTRPFSNYFKTFKITPSDGAMAYIPITYFEFKANLKHQIRPKIFEKLGNQEYF